MDYFLNGLEVHRNRLKIKWSKVHKQNHILLNAFCFQLSIKITIRNKNMRVNDFLK